MFPMKVEIGQRIRKIRAAQLASQNTIAEKLGITAGAYAKIERGETDPSISRLFQIAEVLKVSINDILEDDSKSKQARNEPILQNQVSRLLTEMEKLKNELKKIPKQKK